MIHTNIQIDGVDKTGKDLILKYVVMLSNHKYVIQSRGLLSQMAYSKIYDRPYSYSFEDYPNTLFIYLTGELEDLTIRHKLTDEPKINIEKDMQAFEEIVSTNKNLVHTFNTSKETPYNIAKQIIALAEEKEKHYV